MPPIEQHSSEKGAEKQQPKDTQSNNSGLSQFAQDLWQGGSNAWSAVKDTASAGLHDMQIVGDTVGGAAKSVGASVLSGAESVGTSTLNTAESLGTNILNTAEKVGTSVMNGAEQFVQQHSDLVNVAEGLGAAAMSLQFGNNSLFQNAEMAGLKSFGSQAREFAKDHPEATDIAIDVVSTGAGIGATAAAAESVVAAPLAPEIGVLTSVATKNALRASLGMDVNVESVVTGALDGLAGVGIERLAAGAATHFGVDQMIKNGVTRLGVEPASDLARFAAKAFVPLEHGAEKVATSVESAATGVLEGVEGTAVKSVAKDGVQEGVERVASIVGDKATKVAAPIGALVGASQESVQAGVEKITQLVGQQMLKAPEYLRGYAYDSAGEKIVASAESLISKE